MTAIGKDTAGRLTSLTWKTSDNHQIVSGVTRTRSGTIVDESLGGTDPNPAGNNYSYDAAGRLTDAYVTGHHYTYDFTSTAAGTCPTGSQANAGLNTNRMRLLDQTSGGTAITNYCYDGADRLLTVQGATPVTGIGYDSHGNTTAYTSGGVTTLLGFDSADRNIQASSTSSDPSQNAVISYGRDATDRIVRRDASSGDTPGTVLYGYTGSGDSADITYDVNKRLSSFTISLPGGVLLTNQSPAPTWDYPSVRGDLVLTATNTGVQQGDLRTYDPYGQPLTTTGTVDPQIVPDNSPGKMDNGWLGQHQRPYEHAGGLALVQMGARVYSPLLGRFLQVDPVEGGSANDYDYVGGDPINGTDLDGNCWICGALLSVVKVVTVVATVASYIPGPIGIVASAVATVGNLAQGNYVATAVSAAGLLGGGFIGHGLMKSGVKVFSKFMKWQAKAPLIGARAKLFRYTNNAIRFKGFRVGWTKDTGSRLAFRYGFRNRKWYVGRTSKIRLQGKNAWR